MSEFGQRYRVHSASPADLSSMLRALNGWVVGEVALPDGSPGSALSAKGATAELTDLVYVEHDASTESTTLDLWKLEAHDAILKALSSDKHTFLTHVFHTGAGFDELQVYVDGALRISEDLGERYAFTAGKTVSDLDYDHSRSDDWGRSYLKPVPLRSEALERLAGELGPAAALIKGWQACVEHDLPLYYLPGLG